MSRSAIAPQAALAAFSLILALILTLPGTAQAKTYVDMAGREVELPEKVGTIYAASPPALYLLYAVAPETIAGLNFPFNDLERPWLKPEVVDLPVLGGWFGQGRTPNVESVMAAHADVMLAWYWKDTAINEKVEQTAATMGLPVYYVRLETISEYAEAFRKVAELTGKPERGELLARHAEDVVAEVDQALAGLRDEDRVSVYYAQGPDGLRTECNRSSHATLIEMAGGRNVQQCDPSSGFGMETVSIEEVVVKDPKVIVAQQPTFTDSLDGDARWALVSAVREGRVHLIPREPFNWFDRPPSFMRVMGLRWLTSLLYPERYAPDMEAETREFYKLFLDINLTDEQVRHILHR